MMIWSQSSAQLAASCSGPDDAGTKRIVPSKGFAVDGDPPRSQPAAKLLLLKKIQLKENIASYSQPRSYGLGYWPVIALLTVRRGSIGAPCTMGEGF
jgi:hypothetical protein